MKDYIIRFDAPAENSIHGWKSASLALGNGYMGVNVFGGVSLDRLQLTEPTLVTGSTGWIENRYNGGQESFGDLLLSFPTLTEASSYERTLSLNTAIATTSFICDGVRYTREYFTSYPDRVGVVHLCANQAGKITLRIRAEAAYLREHLPTEPPVPFTAKSATVTAKERTIMLSGFSEYYGIVFEGMFRVINEGGTLRCEDGDICVEGADSVSILYTLGTNYHLEEKTFLLPREQKLLGNPSVHEILAQTLTRVEKYSYFELKKRHIEDHSAFFCRSGIDLGGVDDGRTTHALIADYRDGKRSAYLEEILFQMGRYMSIATSREGTLPPGLQGKWNAYEIAPWTAGYWYNINQQMNYWHIFSTDLAELYAPYLAFNLTRLSAAEKAGDEYIRELHPDKYEEGQGKNGWIVGTGNSAYTLGKPAKVSHSGPGTGGFTVISDIDYYRFTRSPEVLRTVYPILESLGRFYDKCLEPFGDEYLITHSASPEIHVDKKPYVTVGCAFDQQMVYESIRALIDMYDTSSAELTGADTDLISRLRKKVDHLSPVLIGGSGQVKEFREENLYGQFGEPHHRHISQLVGLYPGTVINENTPEWLEAAKKTLHFRGLNTGCGWSYAHKLGMWARVGDGDIAYSLYSGMIKFHLFDNLWNSHDGLSESTFERCVFQAEGNFGATAGVSEMLLCSTGKYICPLYALPTLWADGAFYGLIARGGFAFDVEWHGGSITKMTVRSRAGAPLRIRYGALCTYRIEKNGLPLTSEGDIFECQSSVDDMFTFVKQ